MYAIETKHLYPSQKKCQKCGEKLKECYRSKGRTIKRLDGVIDIVCHVFRCINKECLNNNISIHPEEESILAIKGYNFGLDVIAKIGHLRYFEHKTWEDILAILENKYNLKISLREIGYLEETYLALVNVVAKEDGDILKKLENLSGLILSIDGIKPDKSEEVLYLIREVQTGQILVGEILCESDHVSIQKLLQKVIDLKFPILGIVSDKQESILLAIKKTLPSVPHQLCHYHYLDNFAEPLVKEDSKLKKNLSKGLQKKIKTIEKKLESPETKEQMAEQDIQIVKDYCLAIKTCLKKKSVYPLEPAGLNLYESLIKIKQSMSNCFSYKSNIHLAQLILFLNMLSIFSAQTKNLKLAYKWVSKITSLLKISGVTEQEAKQNLLDYLYSLETHIQDVDLLLWLSHFRKVTLSWLPHLFRFLTQPLLPRTNNDLERFNGQVKKTHRKITGRKKPNPLFLNLALLFLFS